MSKIRILPEVLSNKIAAGEVVERPASVVKELIENSLDADSNNIVVEVGNGGKALVRISDNGIGMSHDDALLAIERYATSKLSKESDLFDIATLGFRGEALPSIAAVSRFSLVTRERHASEGVAIRVEGGKIKDVAEIGAPPGSMITVERLFYNTPARRKFLKTAATEMGHILDTALRIALGWPKVSFKVVHNDKTVKSWPAVADPYDRIVDVLGRNLKNEMHQIHFEGMSVGIAGWISSGIARSTARGIYVFVNGRFVKDKIIQQALMKGYAQKLVKGQFPVAVLFIQVAGRDLDVNVHPTKHQIRFADGKSVYDAVSTAVSNTLAQIIKPGWTRPEPDPIDPQTIGISEPLSAFAHSEANAAGSGATSVVSRELPRSDKGQRLASSPKADDQFELWTKNRFKDLRIIGVLHNTFILCESVQGLVLIDQHAAHERVLFEQIKTKSSTGKPASQRLLMPETIELGYSESEILEKLIPDLNRFGFEIEPFGGDTFVVKSAPTALADGEIKPIVHEMIDKIIDIGFATGMENILDECMMIMACHSAIRANQSLDMKELALLLEQLDVCENPSHCPHGRPIWIEWSHNFLDKAFKRIV